MYPIRAPRCIFDCSGFIHVEWLREVLLDHHKVVLYRRDVKVDETSMLAQHESFHVVSGDLDDVLRRMTNKISLLVDDLGFFHFAENPLELLKKYYDALRWDGEARIRFPNSFWVFLEDQHRVSLQDYLEMKFPNSFRKLTTSDLDDAFKKNISSIEDWVVLKKDRALPHLFFHLQVRCSGLTAQTTAGHAPFLEFIEKTAA